MAEAMMTPEEYAAQRRFTQPLWQSLDLADGEPYGGLFGSDDDNRRGLRVCRNCGAHVSDRGLHYRFHVQLAQMFAVLRDASERTILHTYTENDDPGMIEIRDSDGNLLMSLPQRDPDEV